MIGRKWPETVRNGGRLLWKPRFHWTLVSEEEEEELLLEHCSRKSGLFSTQKFWKSCNWLGRGGCMLRCGS